MIINLQVGGKLVIFMVMLLMVIIQLMIFKAMMTVTGKYILKDGVPNSSVNSWKHQY